MAVAMANRGWLVERGEVHDGDHLVPCHEHVVRPDVTVDELGRELAPALHGRTWHRQAPAGGFAGRPGDCSWWARSRLPLRRWCCPRRSIGQTSCVSRPGWCCLPSPAAGRAWSGPGSPQPGRMRSWPSRSCFCRRCSASAMTRRCGRPPPGQRLGCRPGQRGPPGQHGERLHVRPPQRPAPDRDPPYAAHTKKGTLRACMARELLAAHQAGNVQVVIGRASDYFGPRGGAQSMLGDRVIPAALAGKTAAVLGDPDQPHTYTYLPDIGEGLATLGERPEAPGEVWHLPNDPTPGPPASWSRSSTGWPASPRPSSAAPQHSSFEPWASPTPRSGNCSSCSTSSRNPSSATAPRSPPSWRSTPLR